MALVDAADVIVLGLGQVGGVERRGEVNCAWKVRAKVMWTESDVSG